MGSTATVGFNKTAGMALGNNSAVNADSSFAIGTAAVTMASTHLLLVMVQHPTIPIHSPSVKMPLLHIPLQMPLPLVPMQRPTIQMQLLLAVILHQPAKQLPTLPSSISLGNTATSNSTNAIAIGTGATTGFSLTNPIAIGVSTSVNGNNGIAIGNGANISTISKQLYWVPDLQLLPQLPIPQQLGIIQTLQKVMR